MSVYKHAYTCLRIRKYILLEGDSGNWLPTEGGQSGWRAGGILSLPGPAFYTLQILNNEYYGLKS